MAKVIITIQDPAADADQTKVDICIQFEPVISGGEDALLTMAQSVAMRMIETIVGMDPQVNSVERYNEAGEKLT